MHPGFLVEIGGAQSAFILRVVQQCLTRNAIDSVDVSLGTGEYVLTKED